MSKIAKKLRKLAEQKSRVDGNLALLIEKGLSSNNPADIIEANALLDIEEKKDSPSRAILFDPYQPDHGMGYKQRRTSILTFNTLRTMSYVPLINLIMTTRLNQFASFLEPLRDKYSTGFVIQKKRKWSQEQDEATTPEDEEVIEKLTEFILNCGGVNDFEGDDFDAFGRKFMRDSLTLDQGAFEVSRHPLGGYPMDMKAVDGATIRLASTYSANWAHNNNLDIKGYMPKYIQLVEGRIEAEWYPWELCVGIRNATTNIYSNGYGVSELEVLINVITSMIWSDEYNRKFFSQGAAPKGILKIAGASLNNARLQEFKQRWYATTAGVQNAWRTPIIDADKADWIDLQKSNRDMEWSKWNEFLIKIACATYSIDPTEINFHFSGSEGSSPMFESNNEARIKYSKDKGLYPLLKYFQSRINKFVIKPIAPDFEFAFKGLDSITIEDEIDMLIKKVGHYKTINEVREEVGLDSIGESGDIIANSVWAQMEQAKLQQEQMEMSNEMMMGEEGMPVEPNPFLGEEVEGGEAGEFDAETNNPFLADFEGADDENPFEKAITNFINKLK